MNRRQSTWLLAGIVMAGVAIRSYRLTARSLWFDEAFSWRLINFSWGEMLARTAADVHPPLYYILLRFWGGIFSTSLLSLRSFSIFFAAATIAAVYLFTASAWRSRLTGLTAAALVALSGWQIAFAWEARMYTLGTFLAVITSWLLLKAVNQTQQKIWLWLGYGVLLAAFAYAHYFALFSILAQIIFILIVLVFQTRWRLGEILQSKVAWFALAAGGVAALLFSPWLTTFLQQNAQVQASFWVPPIGGWSIPDTFYRMFFPTAGVPSHTGSDFFLAIIPLAGVILIWLWLAFFRGFNRQNSDSDSNRLANWLVVLAGLVPFLMSITISMFGRSLYQDRYLVFANIFIFIGLARLLTCLPRPWWRRVSITVFLGGFVLAYLHYWQSLEIPNKPGAHAAARQVFSQAQSGDGVLVSSPFVYFAIDHYAQEEYGGKILPKIYSDSNQFLHFAGGPIFTTDDFLGPEALAQKNYRTVWAVDTTGFGGSRTVLPNTWRLQQQWSYPEIYSYQGDIIVKKYER